MNAVPRPGSGSLGGVPRLKHENDVLMDKLGRIMQAMSGASQDLVTLRRQARRLQAENTSLRAELRQLRRRLGNGAAPTPRPASSPGAAPTPAASPSPGSKPAGALSAAPHT
jgi:hypothetical protein